jgi:hypothetical protein
MKRDHRNQFALFAAAACLGLVGTAAATEGLPLEPLPPGNAAPTLRLPPRDAAGDFQTPNRDLHGERAFWNVRIALNVAAIGCRGPRANALVADYNRLLDKHAQLVRTSETQVIAGLARSEGGNGIAARDKLSTRLFNYFAQPPAQRDFCDQAAAVASELAEGSSDHARLRATALLAKLDQPFVDFYHAYDRYRVEHAAWRALTGPAAPRGGEVQQARFSKGQ